jgi:integrase
MSEGHLFKRCGCRDPHTRKPLGSACPKLRRPGGSWSSEHGVWHYQLELPRAATGRRRQLRRGGFATGREAGNELEHAAKLLDLAGGDPERRAEIAELLLATVRADKPLPDLDTIRQRIHADVSLEQAPTVAAYLTEWLAGLPVDENTRLGYGSHVRIHLIPHLGHLRLDKLKPRHVKAMFAKIEERNATIRQARASDDPEVRASVRGMRPTGPATCQRIRATLRKAINDALAEELMVGANPAALVKTPGDRAKPIVWEPERVARWQATGEVPGPVMVWTDEQVAAFLDYAAEHASDLHAMFHFIAYRGPRRGEACGLRDSEVRLGKREATINNQIATIGSKRVQKPPKSRAGNRDVVLDEDTAKVLAAYKARRAAWQLAAGAHWPDTGLFFVRPDGHAWRPDGVSQRFRRLIARAGLPPIRLHDLRHSAATIALAAGVDIKVVSEQLGHTTTTLTRDTYQSVVKQLHHDAADAVAKKITGRRSRLPMEDLAQHDTQPRPAAKPDRRAHRPHPHRPMAWHAATTDQSRDHQ